MAAERDDGRGRPEIELKLRARPEDLERLRQHFAARGGAPEESHVVTGYYDTPQLALARSGVALRVRHDGTRLVQGLKERARNAAGATMGAARRREWEGPVSGDRPELTRLAEPAGRLVPEHLRPALRRIFDTDVRRTRFDLALDGDHRVEIAVDDGQVVAGTGSLPIAEVELELKPGAQATGPADAARLYELALELQQVAPLEIATQSKADLGFGLAGASAPGAAKAEPPALRQDVSAAEGFRSTMRSCVAHLLENERPARATDAMEGVHQMRVAVRRLRSALKLFGPLLASAETAWIEAELKWLGGELGAVRDWDVFCAKILPALSEKDPEVAAALVGPAAARRIAARQRLAASLAAPRYTTLLLTLGAWVEADRWCAESDERLRRRLAAPLEARAGRLIERLEGRVRKAGRGIAALDDTERHELRKALKKLRYGVDFVGALYRQRSVKHYLRPLKRLQEKLGDLNDLVASAHGADQLAGEAGPFAAAARARFERQLSRRLRGLDRCWRDFAAAEPFW